MSGQFNIVNKVSGLSIVKIKGTDSPIINNKLFNNENKHNHSLNYQTNKHIKHNYQQLSQQNNNNHQNRSPHQKHNRSPHQKHNRSSHQKHNRQQYWNKLSLYFKKEIKTHEKNIKQNPRIKLISNTQQLINNKNKSFDNKYKSFDNKYKSFDKYILHSTKKLKIITENNLSKYQQPHSFTFNKHSNNNNNNNNNNNKNNNNNNNNNSNNKNNQYFISLPQNNNQQLRQDKINNFVDDKKKKSQQSKRIFKGITSRKNNKIGRFSVQLQKYQSNQNQNQQDYVQHTKINLYQSLIYPHNITTNHLPIPLTQSLGSDYAKINRSKSPQDNYNRKRGKTKQNQRGQRQYAMTGFPTKRAQSNQPQVLTIHIKRPQNKFRSSIVQRVDRNSNYYYHPRPVPISNINIFKRPNTTTVGGMRKRNDSEIEPW